MKRVVLPPVDVHPAPFGANRGMIQTMPCPHRHNGIEFGTILSGSHTYRFGQEWHRSTPGETTVGWAAVPHQVLSATPGSVAYSLNLPEAWFFDWQLPSAFVAAVMHGRVLIDPDRHPPVADAVLFERWAADLRDGSLAKRQIVLLEIEARIRRIAWNVETAGMLRPTATRHPPPSPGTFSKAEAMARFIAEHCHRTLYATDIAGSVGLNPRYAMRLFHATFGVSLMEYLSQHRIFHAQRLLATTDRKVLEIALASGFGSSARFYATFQRHCGQSPVAYRKTTHCVKGYK